MPAVDSSTSGGFEKSTKIRLLIAAGISLVIVSIIVMVTELKIIPSIGPKSEVSPTAYRVFAGSVGAFVVFITSVIALTAGTTN